MGGTCTVHTRDFEEVERIISLKNTDKFQPAPQPAMSEGGYYDYRGNMFTLENDVGDFLLLSHDVIREVLKRCEDAIVSDDRKTFQKYWDELVDFQEVHHTLYDGHVPGKTKHCKGLFEVLLKNDKKKIKNLCQCHSQLNEAESLVTLTLQQDGWCESLFKMFRLYAQLNLRHLEDEEAAMMFQMLQVRHWRKEFQRNVLPPALKLDFGKFIGYGVKILEEIVQEEARTSTPKEVCEDQRVSEWIRVFYKLATKKQWKAWHVNIHDKLLVMHEPSYTQSDSSEMEKGSVFTFE